MKNNAKLTILQINDTHGYLDIHQEWFAVPQQPVYHLAGGVAQHPTARRG
jgi:2',3'-cyclic-nucleotide 2'-phosphodiesterase (5'-nucleotidase family)